MTNIDIIKEYVNTGVKLPESQISKLTPELKATYLRKRIMVQDTQQNLGEYEWDLMNIKQKELCIEKLGYGGFYELLKNSSNKDKLKQEYKTIKGKDFIEYQWVGNYYEGFARVKVSEDTFNFIDKQGKLLLKQNFEWGYSFRNGFAVVKLSEDSWNYIDKEGNFLSKEQNFKRVYPFHEGFGKVKLLDDTYNFIDTKGNFLSKQNFNWVDDFEDGFAEVELSDGEFYYIDKDLNFYDYYSKTPVPNPFNKVNESLRDLIKKLIKEELKRKNYCL
jgi:hypothetical protein